MELNSVATQNAVICSKWLDFQGDIPAAATNATTEAAYAAYSRFYAPLALLAYLIVWRGYFLRHVKFFREILRRGKSVIDLATGDGSTTSLALFKSKKMRADKIVGLDISSEMLEKAYKKRPPECTQLIRGDICQLPFQDHSVSAMSCFGGLNSFPSGGKALQEMARCLNKNGILRGSVLLLPKTPWRQNLVKDWIKKCYQTEEVNEQKFRNWVNQSSLHLSHYETHGYVLLFELKHGG